MPRYVRVKQRVYVTETNINEFNKKVDEISQRMEDEGLQVDISSNLMSNSMSMIQFGGCRGYVNGVYTAEIIGSEVLSEWTKER